MSYKNTMKLFVSNFTLAWKQLLYLLCCFFLFALCSYTLLSPVVNILRDAGLAEELKKLIDLFYSSPKDIAIALSDIVELIFKSLIANFSKFYMNIIGLVLISLTIHILVDASIYNISSIIFQKATMNMDVGYCQNFLKNSFKSIKFALANIIIALPYLIAKFALLYAYLLFSSTVFKAIIGLVILSTFSIVLSSIKITFFSYYTGDIVNEYKNPFNSFSHSLKYELKNFWKIMGPSVIIILTAILINGVIAIFTFFAGLIFTIPATFVLLSIYKIITYLNISGNRYYLSNSVIYNPQKYIIKKDEYVTTFLPQEEIKEITTTKMKKGFSEKKEKHKKQKKNKISN